MRFPDAWPKSGLWRHPDFLRLWAAQIVSAWGGRITRTALPLIALTALDQSDLALGMLAALQIAPGIVLALFAGGMIDRGRKRRILIVADVVRALLVTSLPIAYWTGALTMTHLIVVGAGVGAATTLFSITDNTYLPALIGKENLVEGNSKIEASEAVAEIAGPSAGGVLIGLLGAPIAVLIDAATYVWSVLFLSRIDNPGEPIAEPKRRDVFGDLRIGLRAVFGHPILRPIAVSQMAWYGAAGAFIALYQPFCWRTLHLSETEIGAVIGCGGIGALLGALVARRLRDRHGLGPTMAVASLISMLATLLIPLATGPHWLVLAFLITHQIVSDGAMVVVQVHATTTQQTLLPQAVLGRASAAVHVCAISMMPIAAVIFGAAGSAMGTRTALWIGLGLGCGAPLALATLWRIRTLPSATHAEIAV